MLIRSLNLLKWHHLFPHNRWGDAWHSRLHCLRYNGHWPRDRGGGLADFLTYYKGSGLLDTPLARQLTDKQTAKEWVVQQLGEGYSPITLAILDRPEQLQNFEFPATCVIKPTQLSGAVVIRHEGEPLPLPEIVRWFSTQHYRTQRERNYRAIRPRVLVETLIPMPFREYRVLCLRGEPRVIKPRTPRVEGIMPPKNTADTCLDAQGRALNCDFSSGCGSNPDGVRLLEPPQHFAHMLELACQLSRDLLFVSVDMFHTPQGIKIGEMTLVPCNGVLGYSPNKEGEERLSRSLFGSQGFCLRDFPELGG
jgi:hypothetical protein